MASDVSSFSPSSSVRIMKRLKEETAEYHEELESLPFFVALSEKKLRLEHYVHQLRSLAIICGVFESEIQKVNDAKVNSIWHDDFVKLPLLNEDIDFFKPRVIAEDFKAIDFALKVAGKIRLRRTSDPLTLLGYLYVLEGTTLGNDMHLPDIVGTFRLKGLNGCRYYASYGEQVHAKWAEFSANMNATVGIGDDQNAVIEAAKEAFDGLEELYTELYHLEEVKKVSHVTRINPEAGNHPIPEDELEIQAALKASAKGWDAFPYYEHRYGSRGKRFSDSDCCWLVTLTALEQQSLQKQIDWLSGVLSSRGMPSLMLECTLRFLSDELILALPEKTSTYQKLRVSAENLAKKRSQFMDEKMVEAVCTEFSREVGPELDTEFKNMGELLVSAVIDEEIGAQGSLAALVDWLTDEKKFPQVWIEAVHATVEQSRNNLATSR